MLREIFTEAVLRYTRDKQQADELWDEIDKSYSGKKRYYHNLEHLEYLHHELTA